MSQKIWVVIGAVVFLSIAPAWAIDSDGYGIEDAVDNCPTVFNPQQRDTDGDGIGNDCDWCLLDAQNDVDGDGRCANVDNCPTIANAGQEDADSDGIGDACDNCPTILGSTDFDSDGVQQCEDNCPTAFNPEQGDGDGDEVGDICDACVFAFCPQTRSRPNSL